MARTRSQGPAQYQGLDRIRRARRYKPKYNSGDSCKRHRLPDGKAKTNRVRSYTRR